MRPTPIPNEKIGLFPLNLPLISFYFLKFLIDSPTRESKFIVRNRAGGIRTHTGVTPADFKSAASAISPPPLNLSARGTAFGVNYPILLFLSGHFGIDYAIANIVGIGFASLANFLINHHWTYAKAEV